MTAERRPRIFLVVAACVFLPFFALPLFIDPYWWAEQFSWDTGPKTDLGNYFGRCLGAAALALAGTALVATRDPARYRALFTILTALFALLAIVHLRGLVEDSQPLIEHLETGGYAGIALLTWWCRPPDPAPG